MDLAVVASKVGNVPCPQNELLVDNLYCMCLLSIVGTDLLWTFPIWCYLSVPRILSTNLSSLEDEITRVELPRL